MKLTEFLTEIGKPVAYYPNLRHITKSVTATIFLCQFIYWIGKGRLEDGWIYKSSKEIEEETGLSYTEQKTAREKLLELDLLEERYARLDHQMLFRVNTIVLDELWASCCNKIPELSEPEFGNQGSLNSLISNTEITTKNTTSITSGKKEPKYDSCDEDGITEEMKQEERGFVIREDVKSLRRSFTELTKLNIPKSMSFAKQRNLWWTPLEEMLELADNDLDLANRLMASATDKLLGDSMTISTPKSLVKTFTNFSVAQKRGVGLKRYLDPDGKEVWQ